MSDVKKDIKILFFNNTVIVLSAFLGLFLAYVVQASYNVFSYSAEASSIVVNYNATEYYGSLIVGLIKVLITQTRICASYCLV
ncbi:MAG: hypothetical protein JSV05_04140 [Candidatus Bathyarchaeota archaeon]|nr:MAG: hypothetical protein JSV05_04140 [Candidatus Bathyarchaeota archaeon]